MNTMNKTDDGGPAFPQAHHSIHANTPEAARELLGMSLRDWFAGQALVGILTKREGIVAAKHATAAYRMADDMLAARKGGSDE